MTGLIACVGNKLRYTWPMIEVIIFFITGLILYVLADQIVRAIEKQRGETLEQRSLLFFVIFFALAIIAFQFVPYIFNK